MLKQRFVIYRDRSFKVAEISSYVPGKITAKNSHTFMKPTSILAPTCVLELAQMNECYLFAGFCARYIEINGSTKLAPAILLKPIIECKQPKDKLDAPPRKIPQKLKKYEPLIKLASEGTEQQQKVFVLFPHQQAVFEDKPQHIFTVNTEEQNDPDFIDSSLFNELSQTAKNRAMLQCIVDIDTHLQKWLGSHKLVVVKPTNALQLLQREVIVQLNKDTKSAEKQGKRGILLNYEPSDHTCFIRLYNFPFGFWFPLKQHNSDFRIIVNLRRGFASSAALRNLDIQMPLINSDQLFSYDQKESCLTRTKSRIPTNLITKSTRKGSQCQKCKGQQDKDEYIECAHCAKIFHTECLKKAQLSSTFSEWLCPQCVRCVNCLSMSTDADKMITCASCNKSSHYQCMRLGTRAIIPTNLINDINQVRIKIELAGDATQVSVLGGNYAAAGVDQDEQEELKFELEGESSNLQSEIQLDVVGSQSPQSHHGFQLPKKQQLIWRCENCVTCSNCSLTGAESAEQALEQTIGPNHTILTKVVNMEERKLVHPPTESELDPLASSNISQYCWATGFQYCNRCRIKKQNREYCPVCMKLWGAVQEPKLKNKRNQKRRAAPDMSQQDQAMIECQCGFWVHLKCDPHLTQKAMHSYQDGRQYSCPRCQRDRRNKNLVDFVNALIKQDRNGYFYFPVNTDLFPNYLKVVKKPMCLQRILQNAHNEMYITAPQKLQEDFELVCKNAIIFNMPKEKIYKEALRLLLIVRDKFQKYMDILIEWKNTEIAMEEFIQKRCAGEEPAKLETPNFEPAKVIEPEQPGLTLESVDLSYENEPDYSMTTEIRKDHVKHYEGKDDNISEGVERAGKMLRKRKQIDYTKQIVSDSSIAGKTSNKPEFQNYFDAPDPPKRKGAEGIVHIDQNNKVTLNIGMMEPTDTRQTKNLMQSFAVQERKKKSRKSVHAQQQQPTVRQKQVSSLAHDLEDCREFLEEKARDQSGQNGMIATTSYYPGPAVFSFEQPSLVYERSCLVCGSFGSDEELLTCDLCGESFHPFCVGLQISNFDAQALQRLRKSWKCLNCRFCQVCHSASQQYSRIVYCDICDKAYHLLCLKPQLKHIPNVMWRCPECFQCSSCKSHKFWNGSEQEFEQMNLSK